MFEQHKLESELPQGVKMGREKRRSGIWDQLRLVSIHGLTLVPQDF